MCRTHPYSAKTRTQPSVRTFAPTHGAIGRSGQCSCDLPGADRLMRRIAHGAFTPGAAFGLWRHRPRLMLTPPQHRLRVDASSVLKLMFGEPVTQNGVLISGI